MSPGTGDPASLQLPASLIGKLARSSSRGQAILYAQLINMKYYALFQGLFFYHTRKIGLGVGFKWGSGVLFTHILDEDGKESWSAPVLYKVHEVSLGLLAGMAAASPVSHALAFTVSMQ